MSTLRAPTSPAATEDPFGTLADLGEHARATATAVARSGVAVGLSLFGRLRAGLGAALAPPVTHVTNVAPPPPASPPPGPPPAPRAPRKPRSPAATPSPAIEAPLGARSTPAPSNVVEKPDTFALEPSEVVQVGPESIEVDTAFEASKLAAEQSRARAEEARRPRPVPDPAAAATLAAGPPLPAPSPAVAAAVERARARAARGTPVEPQQRVLLETRAAARCTVGLGCVLPDGHAGIHRGSLPHPAPPAGTLPDGRPNLFGDEPFTRKT